MAVNSWLITIKRRIKLPLVPPGGTAAISPHWNIIVPAGTGWLACCLATASSHLLPAPTPPDGFLLTVSDQSDLVKIQTETPLR